MALTKFAKDGFTDRAAFQSKLNELQKRKEKSSKDDKVGAVPLLRSLRASL
jgi:hypothetical protein